MPHWLAALCSRLDSTWLSQFLQRVEWIVPLVQTVHILAIGVIVSAVFVFNLQLIGVVRHHLPLSRAAARFQSIVWWTLPVLLITGIVLIIAEPARSLGSTAFQLKMVLLACAVTVTLWYRRLFARDATRDPAREKRGRRLPKFAAVVCMLLWVGIIFAGRWIAYAPGR
jgi:hypothetical protein